MGEAQVCELGAGDPDHNQPTRRESEEPETMRVQEDLDLDLDPDPDPDRWRLILK